MKIIFVRAIDPNVNDMIKPLADQGVMIFAIASAVIAGNAYYIHPIIGIVAESFGVTSGMAGLVPALNQLALALGILFLLPLADFTSNRRIVEICLVAQLFALFAMAVATDFYVFLAASTVLGFFTITPYLLPAYVSKRVDAGRLGYVTALLTTGVIAGVQVSRFGAGIVAEYLGWRIVYWVAALLMTLSSIALPLLMDSERFVRQKRMSYPKLLGSLFALAVAHPAVLISGIIQSINFGIFMVIWIGIGLHLTSDGMGHGSDLVGGLSAFSAIAVFFTPAAGWCIDRLGPERARVIAGIGQFLGVLTLALSHSTWWYLLFPIALSSILGPVVDIAGRTTGLRQPAEVRTRLMSLYITLMFVGGGVGSFGAALLYEILGWTGVVLFAGVLSAMVCVISIQQLVSITKSGMAE